MDSNEQNQIFAVLILIICALTAICIVGGAVLGIVKLANPEPTDKPSADSTGSDTADTDVSVTPQEVILEECPDVGMEYIDSMIFFGESTTAHLRSRGVLTGGTETHQVWADASGTQRLSSHLLSNEIIYPPTQASMKITDACAAAKPDIMVLSFGHNGLEGFIANKSSYVNNYGRLIAAIQAASPETKIILQTVYPIRATGNYSADLKTLNRYIDTLNSWLPEIAAQYENVRVADTASVLKNAENELLPSYDNGDGIHLTASAYREILGYLRTHAWQ